MAKSLRAVLKRRERSTEAERGSAAEGPDQPVGTAEAPAEVGRDVEATVAGGPPVVGLQASGPPPRLPAERVGSSLAAVLGEHAGLRFAGASAAGRSHAGEGRHNDDAFAWRTRGESLVVAIADGASSAELAALASRRAVRTALDAAAALPPTAPETLLGTAVDAGRAAVLEGLPDQESRDRVATTLAVAVVRRSQDGLELWYRSIGNTHVFAVARDGRLDLHAQPGETFLTWPDGRVRAVEGHLRLNGEEAVLLATDGIGSDLVRSETVRRWLGPELLALETPLDAAGLTSYHLQGSGDDRTFVTIRSVDGG